METIASNHERVAFSQEPELGFGEPWQAEAFATALQLSRSGIFTWTEWVETFSTTIASQPMQDGESIGDAYYRQWMTALESMLGTRLCVSEQVVSQRQARWYDAYLNTRHGDPVLLANASVAFTETSHREHEHHHHHHHSHDDVREFTPKPATVVKARV